MKATRGRDLALAFLVAALVTWPLARLLLSRLPALSAEAWVPFVVLALAEAVYGRSVREWVAGRRQTRALTALSVARAAALARASSLGGAVVAGGWAGGLLVALTDLQLRVGRADALAAGAGLLASVSVVLAALYLERGCRAGSGPR